MVDDLLFFMHRVRIMNTALSYSLPTVVEDRAMLQASGLLCVAFSSLEQGRAAAFIIKIFRRGVGASVTFGLAVALIFFAVFPSHAEQAAKVYRIGFLGRDEPPASDHTARNCPAKGGVLWRTLVEELRQRGYVQEQNLFIDCRYSETRWERALPLAMELVSLKVDLLVVLNTGNVRAAKQATSTIPIVMVDVIDPGDRGLVKSLARPGGNVTGCTDDVGQQIGGKYLQLLTDIVPHISRVSVLVHDESVLAHDRYDGLFATDLEAAARALGVTLQWHRVQESEELQGAFATMTKAGAEGILVLPDPFMLIHRQRIVDLVTQSRLPGVYFHRTFVEQGGLLSYAADKLAVWRCVGVYVDKILKGAKPADLPVEQPKKFELVINLRTAKALGLKIPQSLLLGADELIE